MRLFTSNFWNSATGSGLHCIWVCVQDGERKRFRDDTGKHGAFGALDNAANTRHNSARECKRGPSLLPTRSEQSSAVANAKHTERGTEREVLSEAHGRDGFGWGRDLSPLGDTGCKGLPERISDGRIQREAMGSSAGEATKRSSLTDGFWANAEWIPCRYGKYRPIEPGSSPLATGITNRVGKLRGYGNALTAPVAQGFIEAYLEVERGCREAILEDHCA